MSTEQQTAEAAPAAPPAPATSATETLSAAPMDLAAIEAVRDSDISRYFAEGLDVRWRELTDAAAAETDRPTFTAEDLEVLDDPVDDGDAESDGEANAGEIAEASEDAGAEGEESEAEDTANETTPTVDLESVPDDPYYYGKAQIPGHQWTDEDQPLLEMLNKRAHAEQLNVRQVHSMQKLYTEIVAANQERVEAADAAAMKAGRAELVKTWGGEDAFKTKISQVNEFLKAAGEIGERIAQARDANGLRLANDPRYIEILARMVDGQPAGQGVAPSTEQAALADEEADLERLMHTSIGEYMNAPWRRTGLTGSERLLQIKRTRTAVGRR